jgi:hypothetical protein
MMDLGVETVLQAAQQLLADTQGVPKVAQNEG